MQNPPADAVTYGNRVWPADKDLQAGLKHFDSVTAFARYLGIPRGTLRDHLTRRGIEIELKPVSKQQDPVTAMLKRVYDKKSR